MLRALICLLALLPAIAAAQGRPTPRLDPLSDPVGSRRVCREWREASVDLIITGYSERTIATDTPQRIQVPAKVYGLVLQPDGLTRLEARNKRGELGLDAPYFDEAVKSPPYDLRLHFLAGSKVTRTLDTTACSHLLELTVRDLARREIKGGETAVFWQTWTVSPTLEEIHAMTPQQQAEVELEYTPASAGLLTDL